MKSLFEQLGGTYTLQGDYYLPDLALPTEEETQPIGIWEQRHKRYLQDHKRVTYTNLLKKETLFTDFRKIASGQNGLRLLILCKYNLLVYHFDSCVAD